MRLTNEILADRLHDLMEEVVVLREAVVNLSVRISTLESQGVAPSANRNATIAALKSERHVDSPIQEGAVEKIGRGALLPCIATGCFILVFALILRTVMDSGFVNSQTGSLLGMGYAVALISIGWWLYSKKGRLAPVFPVFGLLLLLSIVYELHGRFDSLSTFAAYGLQFIAGLVVVVLGFRHLATMTLCLGVLGPCLAAMGIDFPYPVYPVLSVFLIGSGIAAYLAHQRGLCPTLRWSVLSLTVLFWLFWSFKLTAPAVCDEPTSQLFYLGWYYPILLFSFFMYLYFSIRYVLTDPQPGFYNGLLPTIIGLGAFAAAHHVFVTWNGRFIAVLGGFAAVIALGMMGVAAWLAKSEEKGAPGSNIFVFAGVSLFAVASIAAVGNRLLLVLPLWAVGAYFLARLAGKWESGGVRVTSYLLQAAACIVAMASGTITTDVSSAAAGGLVAAVLMVMSLLQYRWCRDHKPATINSAFFSWLDKNDFSAVILLLAGLLAGFCLFRIGVHEVLLRISSDVINSFRGIQTVLINLGAVLLMVIAVKKRSAELLIVAVCIALIGGARSFIFDLFGIKGIPLVMSIFSFGVVAAVGSVVSSRWQKIAGSRDTAEK